MDTLRGMLVLLLIGVAPARAQDATPLTPAALEGAWIRTTSIAADGSETPSPPGVRTFVGGHYSWMQATPDRPQITVATATAEQLRAAIAVTAQSGRYEVSGHTMTQLPIAAMNPAIMDGAYRQTFAVRLVADSMWITQIWTSTGGPLVNQASGKYVRVRPAAAPTN
jgi:hypothetical protein